MLVDHVAPAGVVNVAMSSGLVGKTPKNDTAQMLPMDVGAADSVTVITLPDAIPAGATAVNHANRDCVLIAASSKIVHVNPGPLSDALATSAVAFL
jgi:hypothetical protein